MAVDWSEGRSEENGADDDEDDWKGTTEAKTVTGKLAQEKKNADGGDDRRAHQTANRASAAGAAKLIAHSRISMSPVLLIARPFAKEHDADRNENQGPEPPDA